MKSIREEEAPVVKIGSPHARTIRHLVAPWTLGSKNIWLGTVIVEPGNTSNLHAHENNEEVFYCVSGSGKIKVEDEEAMFEPNMAIYVEKGFFHQLINSGDEPLKVIAITSPPFTHDGFQKDHELK
jgi:mannose-6-phosphate isomerase-like protein (cupin superfamily)